jgi:hypothetical protein
MWSIFFPPLTKLSRLATFFRQLAAFLVREVKRLGPLPRYIRSIERTLVAKLIIQIDRQLRDESIK